jgi:hypothetical protein
MSRLIEREHAHQIDYMVSVAKEKMRRRQLLLLQALTAMTAMTNAKANNIDSERDTFWDKY